eukprot:TRINITY_DN5129_c0_g1_i1.p1 TRINITY_DN5129_c0_g1~~TRINITY_DN5129_c0_g1_i1.p1  ORF type:complete len:333 (+),score=-3.08 TRINITY_DN5129_c0_g1_i1:1259-2257(+)
MGNIHLIKFLCPDFLPNTYAVVLLYFLIERGSLIMRQNLYRKNCFCFIMRFFFIFYKRGSDYILCSFFLFLMLCVNNSVEFGSKVNVSNQSETNCSIFSFFFEHMKSCQLTDYRFQTFQKFTQNLQINLKHKKIDQQFQFYCQDVSEVLTTVKSSKSQSLYLLISVQYCKLYKNKLLKIMQNRRKSQQQKRYNENLYLNSTRLIFCFFFLQNEKIYRVRSRLTELRTKKFDRQFKYRSNSTQFDLSNTREIVRKQVRQIEGALCNPLNSGIQPRGFYLDAAVQVEKVRFIYEFFHDFDHIFGEKVEAYIPEFRVIKYCVLVQIILCYDVFIV